MNSFYDFVPYKFGPFSFTLYRDLERLTLNEIIVNYTKKVVLSQIGRKHVEAELDSLNSAQKSAVLDLFSMVKEWDTKYLVNHVYRKYPWYTIKSENVSMKSASKTSTEPANHLIHTIGYEGRSIDSFLNHLLKEDIQILIDVRANALSRKYGFSKRQLSSLCQKFDIVYCHERSLGVPSKERKNLKNHQSYRKLFERYEKRISLDDYRLVQSVSQVMENVPSALMCFESDNRSCHRRPLADAISSVNGLTINHL
ncbi:MAG: DUF488 domain-containing protein [Gammaproteobacteria bacterium]|nr:DUF488 domain-containing protein [Gammaproteobacteria bacterium]MYF53862.1 DUF488 domain-containing protein [Gammaproteobacteria bacterium]MYK42901.1 DUF488 domain-containing protein [Gammaproteobacteria bacterium]